MNSAGEALQRRVWLWLLFIGILLPALPRVVFADDVTLNVTVQAQEDTVRVIVDNSGGGTAAEFRGRLLLDGQEYALTSADTLPAKSRVESVQRVRLPASSGSYPVVVRLQYRNEGLPASTVTVSYLHHGAPNLLTVSCPERTLFLRDSLRVALPTSGYAVSAWFPGTVQTTAVARSEDRIEFELTNTSPLLASNAASYLVYEASDATANTHATRICENRIRLYRSNAAFSRFATSVVALLALAGFLVAFCLWPKTTAAGPWRFAIVRAGWSIGIVAGLLCCARAAGSLAQVVLNNGFSGPQLSGSVLRSLAAQLLETLFFQGGDYDHFFRLVADPLLLYFVCCNVFVLRWLIRPDPEKEKYSLLLRWTRSWLVPAAENRRRLWSDGAAVGFRAVLVKAFYVPLMVTWTVQNILHQRVMFNIVPGFGLVAWSQYIIDVLVFVDVAIFTLGYLVELPQLRNGIRSVEPTWFGWFICLICYPPFNQIPATLIDRPLAAALGVHPLPGTASIHLLLVPLWGVYAWATIALGMRSSNLTNRGTIDRGPYRYVRHPAYVSKVSVWLLSSYFLGTMSVPYAVLLALIYALRAWTEERHLSADEEYRLYRSRVRWKAVPGVW